MGERRRSAGKKKGFSGACNRAGITDCKFHVLRHTFAYLLVMGGVDLVTAGNFLGHKDTKMTLRYSHLSPSHKAASMGVLDLALQTPANYTKTIQSAALALPVTL
jgi:integrase